MASPLLTIGYSTLVDRVASIELPGPRPDLEILVVVQGGPIDAAAARFAPRADVEVIADEGSGVARSRNVVLRRASGRYLAFGDDDATWNIAGLFAVIEFLGAHPEESLVLAMVQDEHGRLRKKYPHSERRLHRWNSARAGTIELVVRTDDVRNAAIGFDENFGAGAANFLGDEYVFVSDALAAGLRGRFVPTVISQHPVESSGSAFGTVDDARSRSAVFDRVFGWQAPIARLAFLARRPRRFGSFRLGVQFVLGRFESMTVD